MSSANSSGSASAARATIAASTRAACALAALGRRGRPAHEGHLGSQAKDVIEPGDDVVGDVEERVQPVEVGCGAARRPDSDDAAMVDELEGRGHRGGVAIEVKRSGHRRDRARRRGGAGARRAVGEYLGIALIEPGDGIAQPIAGEDLAPPLPSLRVDLDRTDYFSFKGTEVELLVCYPACRVPHAA